jgi:hypothetical protein
MHGFSQIKGNTRLATIMNGQRKKFRGTGQLNVI